MADSTRQKVQNRLEALKRERNPFEQDWKDCADYVDQSRGRFQCEKPSEKRRQKPIYNSRAKWALDVQTSGMMAGVTSPARPWFNLETPDPEMMESAPVKIWLDDVVRIMHAVMGRSNFYNSAQMVYRELGLFGVNAIGQYDDFERIMRCETYTIGSYWLAANGKREIDTLYREYQMTVRGVVDRFGLDKVSRACRNLYDRLNYDAPVKVIHAVEPNDSKIIDSPWAKDKPWRSVYVEEGNDQKDALLLQSGFDSKPFMAPRWSVNGEDVYSMGYPAINCLGDNKSLQVEEIDKANAIEKMHNPPLVGDASLKAHGGVNAQIAGGITYVPDMAASSKPGLSSVYDVNPRVNELMLDIQAKEQRIDRAFYADLFLMISEMDRAQITATEILERKEEKMLMIGPVLMRLFSELLDPVVDRTFEQCMKAGMFPPPPQDLVNMSLNVEYVSVLAQAQKAVSTAAIESTVSFAAESAQVWPEAPLKIDIGQAIDEYGKARGASPKIVRSDKAFEAQIAEMRQREQAAQMATMAQTASQVGKDMGQTSTEEGTLAGDMAEAMSG